MISIGIFVHGVVCECNLLQKHKLQRSLCVCLCVCVWEKLALVFFCIKMQKHIISMGLQCNMNNARESMWAQWWRDNGEKESVGAVHERYVVFGSFMVSIWMHTHTHAGGHHVGIFRRWCFDIRFFLTIMFNFIQFSCAVCVCVFGLAYSLLLTYSE